MYHIDYDMETDVTTRVSIHGREEFEMKLEYNLQELEKDESFKVETYLFIPSSLNINKKTYPKESFYHDVRNNLRLKTPVIRLRELVAPGFVQSPLYQLERMKEDLLKEFAVTKVEAAIEELKLLGCIVRKQLRDYYKEMREFLSHVKKIDISEDFENMVEKSFMVLKKLEDLHQDYKGHFPAQKKLLKYFQLTNEFLSNLIEFELVRITMELQKQFGDGIFNLETIAKLKKRIEEEGEFRSKNNFRLHFDKSTWSYERYLFYMSQYKKALASVLYLNILQERPKNRYFHLIGGLAAFAASVFSFITLVLLSRHYAIDTVLFISLASLSYVFKDRIKELIKLMVNPRMLSRFPDFDTLIRLQGDPPVNVGNFRVKHLFVDKEKIDPTVLSMREETIKGDYLYEEMAEDIMLYQKEITFNINNVLNYNSRYNSVTDILRYNIARYMLKMNEPDEEIYYYDSECGELQSTTGARCYFLNLIIKYTSYKKGKQRLHYERYRIVVRKTGIEEIEEVSKI